jgi:hypothetical protein
MAEVKKIPEPKILALIPLLTYHHKSALGYATLVMDRLEWLRIQCSTTAIENRGICCPRHTACFACRHGGVALNPAAATIHYLSNPEQLSLAYMIAIVQRGGDLQMQAQRLIDRHDTPENLRYAIKDLEQAIERITSAPGYDVRAGPNKWADRDIDAAMTKKRRLNKRLLIAMRDDRTARRRYDGVSAATEVVLNIENWVPRDPPIASWGIVFEEPAEAGVETTIKFRFLNPDGKESDAIVELEAELSEPASKKQKFKVVSSSSTDEDCHDYVLRAL